MFSCEFPSKKCSVVKATANFGKFFCGPAGVNSQLMIDPSETCLYIIYHYIIILIFSLYLCSIELSLTELKKYFNFYMFSPLFQRKHFSFLFMLATFQWKIQHCRCIEVWTLHQFSTWAAGLTLCAPPVCPWDGRNEWRLAILNLYPVIYQQFWAYDDIFSMPLLPAQLLNSNFE